MDWKSLFRCKSKEELAQREESAKSEPRPSHIEVPGTNSKIADHAYSNYYELESVVINEGVTEIGHWAFFACQGLKSVTIPASMTRIAGDAFLECDELETLTLSPDNKTFIMKDGQLFSNQGNTLVLVLKNIDIPQGVTEIGPQAFAHREDLPEEMVIPGTVKKIGDYAFECTNLCRVVFSEGVTEIGDCVFSECPDLYEVHLPASLKKLGEAFDGSCYDGMNLYCHMPAPVPYAWESDEGYPPNTNDVLYVPKGAKAMYEDTEPWSYYESIEEMEQ